MTPKELRALRAMARGGRITLTADQAYWLLDRIEELEGELGAAIKDRDAAYTAAIRGRDVLVMACLRAGAKPKELVALGIAADVIARAKAEANQ